MKLNTENRSSWFTIVIIGLAVLVLVNVVIYSDSERYGAVGYALTSNYILEIVSGILALILLWGPNSFSYDDTDEVVIIKTRRLIYGDLLGKKSINYEIPRRKIRRVRISNKWFKKYLHITINGKKEVHRIQKLDATLLSSHDLKKMKRNLEAIATNQHRSSRRRK